MIKFKYLEVQSMNANAPVKKSITMSRYFFCPLLLLHPHYETCLTTTCVNDILLLLTILDILIHLMNKSIHFILRRHLLFMVQLDVSEPYWKRIFLGEGYD